MVKVPPGSKVILEPLLDAEERGILDEAEVVYETGAGWWVGIERASGRSALWLTRYVLISLISQPGDKMER